MPPPPRPLNSSSFANNNCHSRSSPPSSSLAASTFQTGLSASSAPNNSNKPSTISTSNNNTTSRLKPHNTELPVTATKMCTSKMLTTRPINRIGSSCRSIHSSTISSRSSSSNIVIRHRIHRDISRLRHWCMRIPCLLCLVVVTIPWLRMPSRWPSRRGRGGCFDRELCIPLLPLPLCSSSFLFSSLFITSLFYLLLVP